MCNIQSAIFLQSQFCITDTKHRLGSAYGGGIIFNRSLVLSNGLKLLTFPDFALYKDHIPNRSSEYPGEKDQLFQ